MRFSLAWDGATCNWGELRGEFMEELSQRAEGVSLQALGAAITGSVHPAGWFERERPLWIGALGLLGIEWLHDRDRLKLVATAELLGLQDVLREYGVMW